MRHLISLLSFLSILPCTYGQDTIRLITGNQIIGKVIEIDKENIKYKKLENLEGPSYILSISEVQSIIYKIGTKEIFTSKTINTSSHNDLDDEELFILLTKKHNKVYIECDDRNAVIHAINALKSWNYWNITDNKEEADFILKFDMVFAGLGDHFGKASFIFPENGRILKTTKEVNTIMSWDMNTKRGVVDKIVNKEIKPMFP